MLVTNHVLAGALVGYAAPGPVSAFVGGVASHFGMDVVPHWGDRPIETVMHIAVADGLTGLAAMAWVWRSAPRRKRWRVLAGMVGGAMPDLDKPSTVFFGFSPFPAAWDEFHSVIQTEDSRRMPQEIVVGAALGLAVLTWSRVSRPHA
ncbi:hypothetical protein D9V37_18230 [Nocardioides mangrovicus]|uniref:Uncharacterized protein n=1 Tax=Nocardioides mangrovicus TaxID=2478913 RepID=A0A3L8NYR2_9ACTN|nr:hypothetical protein [Nocardioides mangrovicus]RLV48034.1 hypothetical protein D9V37_18230 [Nocardioides mangrovicus]